MLKQQLTSELLFILLAVAIALAVVAPPFYIIGPFVGLLANFIIIIGFITVVRLLFFATLSPWLRPRYMKGVVTILAVPAFLATVLALNEMQTYIDANGFAALFDNAAHPEAARWARYVRNEFVFFGSALLIVLLILPVAMIVQLWRQVKATT